MIINFIGDIHVGKKPSHSTSISADRQVKAVDKLVETAKRGGFHKADLVIQLGDLFDSATVTDDDFVRAAKMTRGMDIVVKGNHDFSHNVYRTDAFTNLQKMQGGAPTPSGAYRRIVREDVHIFIVPYQPTQALFEEALTSLQTDEDVTNILCLHTNAHAEGFSASETENNLTEAMAGSLSPMFDLIVSGHEHNSSFKYRAVHMVGSVFPFSFGEMEDKFVLVYDTEKKSAFDMPLWSKETGYVQRTVEEFLAADDAPQFVEIVGEIQSSQVLAVAKKTSLLFTQSEVISIKNSSTVERKEAAQTTVATSDWKETAAEDLTASQEALLEKLIQEVA